MYIVNEQPEYISMDRNKIINFIKKNTKNKEPFNEKENPLIEAMLHIIPLLGHYEEEDKKLNFSISIGINTNMNNLIANYYVLRKISLKNETIEEKIKKIEQMIKQVAIFCDKDANIFLVQNKNEIECGIYILKLNITEKAENSFLENRFIIFEHLYKNKVVVKAKNERLYICMDFDKDSVKDDINDANELSQYAICRKWKGIFERVKRTVHGTICLFVDSDWNPDKDENFRTDIEIVDLNLELKNNPSVDEIQDFNNKLDMFIAMLNYDGITIIDTNEKIKAYNLLYKNNDENKGNIYGGARHMAYECLKNLNPQNRKGYVALYFQSQEGEIEFYKYDNDNNKSKLQDVSSEGVAQSSTKPNPLHYFDASIMNTKTALQKSMYEKIRKQYDVIQQSCVNDYMKFNIANSSLCIELHNLIKNLVNAHNGIDNFYTEPEKAKNLKVYIEKHKNDVNRVLSQYTKMRIDLLSIVFQCVVGHVCGYSWGAQDDLKKIISSIDGDIYIKYFTNKEYLDTKLLWSISSSGGNERWNNILSEIKDMNPNLVDSIDNQLTTTKEYREMYEALTDDNF